MLGISLSQICGLAFICFHFTKVFADASQVDSDFRYGDELFQPMTEKGKPHYPSAGVITLPEIHSQQLEAAKEARRILRLFEPNKTEWGLNDLERLYRIAVHALKEPAKAEDLDVAHAWLRWWASGGHTHAFDLGNDADNFYRYVIERKLGFIKETIELVDWESKTSQDYMEQALSLSSKRPLLPSVSSTIDSVSSSSLSPQVVPEPEDSGPWATVRLSFCEPGETDVVQPTPGAMPNLLNCVPNPSSTLHVTIVP